eukprot:3260213-Rhodomonas_salina.10
MLLLCSVRQCPRLTQCAICRPYAMRCAVLKAIVLCVCYAMPGTEVGYATGPRAGLHSRFQCRQLHCVYTTSVILLCACYAMSGTDVAYELPRKKRCSAMPGTDIIASLYGGSVGAVVLRAYYAMYGTEVAYQIR